MAFKTVSVLQEWLSQRGSDGERLIGRDWLVWVNAGGNITAQHPACPDMAVTFCPFLDDEEDE